MLAEDWVPLLRGAFRLESRMKVCDDGGSKTNDVGVGSNSSWRPMDQMNQFLVNIVGREREPRLSDNVFSASEWRSK